jgi:flavin-dependent dehydrogenase
VTISPAPDVHVVVVGGGPAGSATAIWCARRGLRVALLERERFPRHRPGETLPPGVEPLFGQLGVAEAMLGSGFIRHRGTWVAWSGPRRFDPFGGDSRGPWLGFQAPRAEFDRLLLDEAARSGVVVHQPRRALRPLCDRGRVVGVETPDGPLATRWVVDAGGGAHWLARRLGIPLRFASPRMVARYGYARGSCPGRDEAPEIAADDAGWTWSARIAPGLYQWTRLSLTEDDPRRDSPPNEFSCLTPLARPRGADVTWRMVARPAGPGYVCVGDAAAVLDPASSHGVLKALMSGMMAGHVIAHASSGASSSLAAIRAYTAWITGWFWADVEALGRSYRALPRPPAWARERSASSGLS